MRWGLGVVAGVFGLTVFTWAVSSPRAPISTAGQVSQLLGGLALTGFALTFVLATRMGVLDRIFDGLDRAYSVHKWLAVVALGLVVAHLLTHDAIGYSSTIGSAEPAHAGPSAPGRLGIISLVIFSVLILVALLARRMGYEIWKTIHKLVAAAYGIGLVHYYQASTYQPWGLEPFSLWLDVVNLAGVAAVIYAVLLYERLAFRHEYRVVELRQAGCGNLEVSKKATGLRNRTRMECSPAFHRHRDCSHPVPSNSRLGVSVDGRRCQAEWHGGAPRTLWGATA